MTITRFNRNQEIDNHIQKQELDPLVELFAVFPKNPAVMGSWLPDPIIMLTPALGEDNAYGTGTYTEAGNFEAFKFKINKTIQEFLPCPIEISGLEYTGTAAMPQPILTIANISNQNVNMELLLGSKVEYIQTFYKYLNTDISLPKQSFIIDAVKEETFSYISFILAAPYDVQDVKLPRRRIVGGQCPWIYKAGAAAPTDRPTLIATDTPRGGCTWPADNLYGTDQDTSLIFMNARDEYIVDHRLITASSNFALHPADSGVLEGSYFFTIAPAQQLDHHGDIIGNTNVKLYWQATKSVSADNVEEPSSRSGLWRQVRVYEPYTSTATYRAYTDPSLNEYVGVFQGGRQVANPGLQLAGLDKLVEGFDFIEAEIIDEVISLDAFSVKTASAGGSILSLPINIATSLRTLAEYVADPNYGVANSSTISCHINTRADAGLLSGFKQVGEDETWKSMGSITYFPCDDANIAGADAAYGYGVMEGAVLLLDERALSVHNPFRTGADFSLVVGLGSFANVSQLTGKDIFKAASDGEFLSLWMHTDGPKTIRAVQIYQVKNKTLDPSHLTRNQHGPFPPKDNMSFNFENWTAGDVCSKSLTGCVSRFQAAPVDRESIKQGGQTPGATHFTWFMTPSYSGPTRNVYPLRIPKSGQIGGSGSEGSLYQQDTIKYYKCDNQPLFDSLPDEGFLTIEAYIDGQYRKSFPYMSATSAGNYLIDDMAHSGFDHGLGFPLDDLYYFIKLSPTRNSNGDIQPGLGTGTGGRVTPTGRASFFDPKLTARNFTPTNSIDVDYFKSLFYSTNAASEGDLGVLDPNVLFNLNIGEAGAPINGFIIYRFLIDTITGLVQHVPVMMEGNMNHYYTVDLDPVEAPFILDSLGNMTEINLGPYEPSAGPDDSPGHSPGMGKRGSASGDSHQINADLSNMYNNEWVQPELRRPSPNNTVIAGGTVDPATQTTYKFKFEGFQSSNMPISSTLKSSVPLPFGGFPGSRRFK